MNYQKFEKLQKYYLGEPVDPAIFKQGRSLGIADYSSLASCEGGGSGTDPEPAYFYRMIQKGYFCDGYDKYIKYVKQYAPYSDGPWNDVVPEEYIVGDLIEYNSQDCGYVPPTASTYLTFEFLEDGTMDFHIDVYSTENVQYRKNEGVWTSYSNGTTINGVSGDKIEWKGNWKSQQTSSHYNHFNSNYRYKIYGNPSSLLNGDNFANITDLSDYSHTFYGLFRGTKVVDASGLVLPATTLNYNCYDTMFRECTSLVSAPSLPATTLMLNCYQYMFRGCTSLVSAPSISATTMGYQSCYHMFDGCTSLVSAPSLLATTLNEGCCSYMFAGCTSLVSAPALPATALARSCYASMFRGCTSLVIAPTLPAQILETSCYSYMFYGCNLLNHVGCMASEFGTNSTQQWLNHVASNGTFVKATGSTWNTGASGIPTNWTVIET